MRLVIVSVLIWFGRCAFGAQGGQSRPEQPRPYVYEKRDHGHGPETDPGTPPCGSRDARCPPSSYSPPGQRDQTRENHNGRYVAIGVGSGLFAGLLMSKAAYGSEPVNKLSSNGPQFSNTVHMSAFQVTGFLRGGWPLVIDYETEAGTYVVLSIVTRDALPYSVLLPVPQTGRRIEVLELPLSLGTEYKIGAFTVRATVSQRDLRFRYFRIFGFGCGLKAIGSVSLDQLKFGPQLITNEHSGAKFSFHTHAVFDKFEAEFMQVALVDDCLEGEICDRKKIDHRLSEDEHWSDDWNGKKAHPGQIQFRVRGWMTANSGGDWVSAFSPDLVLKQ